MSYYFFFISDILNISVIVSTYYFVLPLLLILTTISILYYFQLILSHFYFILSLLSSLYTFLTFCNILLLVFMLHLCLSLPNTISVVFSQLPFLVLLQYTMSHYYILSFLLYYYILVIRVYATSLTFCLDVHWAISFCLLLPLYIYKDCSLSLLCFIVITNTSLPITYSNGYLHDLLLFGISNSYYVPIMPLCIIFQYT